MAYKQSRFLFLAAGLMLASPAAWSEKTDPSMIPPDVTFSTVTPPAAAPAAATPGVTPGATGTSALPPGLKTPAAPVMQNGYAVPNTMRGTTSMMKAPGSAFSMDNAAPAPPGATQANQQQASGLYQGSGAAVDPNAADPIVTITTDKGVIQMRLFRKYAPITVESFTDLVSRGFYNGLTFHRVEPGFCIQGGCPNGTGTGLFIDPDTHIPRMLPLETNLNLRHNAPGVVAMARSTSPNSGSCQFFITLSSQKNLDDQYTVFGGVTSGMDVVKSIAKGDKIISATLSQ